MFGALNIFDRRNMPIVLQEYPMNDVENYSHPIEKMLVTTQNVRHRFRRITRYLKWMRDGIGLQLWELSPGEIEETKRLVDDLKDSKKPGCDQDKILEFTTLSNWLTEELETRGTDRYIKKPFSYPF